jgi:hypothetical protein
MSSGGSGPFPAPALAFWSPGGGIGRYETDREPLTTYAHRFDSVSSSEPLVHPDLEQTLRTFVPGMGALAISYTSLIPGSLASKVCALVPASA